MSRLPTLYLLLLMFLLSQPATARMYKWTNEDGHVVFTDNPPPVADGLELVAKQKHNIISMKVVEKAKKRTQGKLSTKFVSEANRRICRNAISNVMRHLPRVERLLKGEKQKEIAELRKLNSMRHRAKTVESCLAKQEYNLPGVQCLAKSGSFYTLMDCARKL